MAEQRIAAGIGGTLALEFANTAAWHLAAEPVERLACWRDVVHWAAQLTLVQADQIAQLSSVERDIRPALKLREAIFRVGVAIARGEPPHAGDINAILAHASSAPPDASWSSGRLLWRFDPEAVLPQVLGIVARDAVALLASVRADRLRLCAGDKCGWLFIDEGRGKPRRWCSMRDCGNRWKAQRAYRRSKRAKSG